MSQRTTTEGLIEDYHRYLLGSEPGTGSVRSPEAFEDRRDLHGR